MATTFEGNQVVQSGYYANLSRWSIEPIAEDGGRLPAGPGRWRRVPTAVALLAPPLLGLAFLMFLPFIGIALTAQVALTPVARFFHGVTEVLVAELSPGYAVGAANLTGKSDAEGEAEERGPPSAWRILAAPFLGLAWVVALPIIAVLTVAHALLRRLGGHVSEGASGLADTVTPDLATGAAYLAGHEDEEDAAGAAEHPDLEALAKELEAKRK